MRYDRAQIDRWVSEWEQSGESIQDYCEGKPFEKSTFYYWRRKVLGIGESNKGSKFIPVQVSPSFVPYLSIHYANGVRVDVHTILSCDEVRTLVGC